MTSAREDFNGCLGEVKATTPIKFLQKLLRTKYIDMARLSETKLSRCLTAFDLTALGIGSTLGAGIYVVAGQVARETAGPAVVLSFLIAALASIMAGLCYAEFGARVPKSGSAYVYSYVTVGEFWAFIIGWNMILEYVIGTASVARAWSSNFDALLNKTIQKAFMAAMPLNTDHVAEYPDFFAFGITMLLTVVLCVGVRESTYVNNVFTGVNLVVVAYVIICGLFKADIYNWQIPDYEIPNKTLRYENGEGGFFPFGFSGMMSGAATCFYAFVGFDAIATTGEEVINPQKAIPFSIITSLLACFVAYFGISSVLTLMCPYFLLDTSAPLPEVFERLGWDVAKYVIAVGAVCGLSTSLLGCMFPMPRVIYAMASDGLLFRFLATINKRFKTPVYATLVAGFLAGVMAMMFDLKELVDMMSIGTLLAYTLVAACVNILRYRPDELQTGSESSSPTMDKDFRVIYEPGDVKEEGAGGRSQNEKESRTDEPNGDNWTSSTSSLTFSIALREAFRPSTDYPTAVSAKIVGWCTLLLGFFISAFSAVIIYAEEEIMRRVWWPVIMASMYGLVNLLLVIIMWRQPQNPKCVTFKVPFLPFLPALSMQVNIYLMLKLSVDTWIRFSVWMTIGFIIYFAYGIWFSSQDPRNQETPEKHDRSRPTSHHGEMAVINSSTKLVGADELSEDEDEITVERSYP